MNIYIRKTLITLLEFLQEVSAGAFSPSLSSIETLLPSSPTSTESLPFFTPMMQVTYEYPTPQNSLLEDTSSSSSQKMTATSPSSNLPSFPIYSATPAVSTDLPYSSTVSTFPPPSTISSTPSSTTEVTIPQSSSTTTTEITSEISASSYPLPTQPSTYFSMSQPNYSYSVPTAMPNYYSTPRPLPSPKPRPPKPRPLITPKPQPPRATYLPPLKNQFQYQPQPPKIMYFSPFRPPSESLTYLPPPLPIPFGTRLNRKF